MATPFGSGNSKPGAGRLAPGQPQSQLPFFQNPFPPADWSAIIKPADLLAAVKSRTMILIVGKDKIPIRVPEDVLRKIPYFDNIISNASHPGTFELSHDNPATVGKIINWLGQAQTPLDSISYGRVARICDEWCLTRFVKTCMSGYWNMLGEASLHGDENKLFEAIKAWYLPMRKHRMRYIAVHFLVARKRKTGTKPPQKVMDDDQFSTEFGKWNYVLDRAEGAGAQPYAGYRGHEILRRLIAGTLTLNWLRTEFNPQIVDKGHHWLTEYLGV